MQEILLRWNEIVSELRKGNLAGVLTQSADLVLVAAAYNAGVGAVTRYKGVPPYAETQAYVEKVRALHQRYQQALGTAPLRPADSTAVESKSAISK